MTEKEQTNIAPFRLEDFLRERQDAYLKACGREGGTFEGFVDFVMADPDTRRYHQQLVKGFLEGKWRF